MNISYELWPIWCDYLEEQGFDTEYLRYYMTYFSCINSFYTYRDYNPGLTLGNGTYYSTGMLKGEVGNGYAYSFWLYKGSKEYGNCYRAFGIFKDDYYGSGKRNIDSINYQTGDGTLCDLS